MLYTQEKEVHVWKFYYFQASARARLGARALKYLADGTPPDDDMLVSIIVDGVR